MQMMQNLVMGEGEILEVRNVTVPVAKYAKFQPQSPDFLQITNPKAVYVRVCRIRHCSSCPCPQVELLTRKTRELVLSRGFVLSLDMCLRPPTCSAGWRGRFGHFHA